jgi:hypothetical protein
MDHLHAGALGTATVHRQAHLSGRGAWAQIVCDRKWSPAPRPLAPHPGPEVLDWIPKVVPQRTSSRMEAMLWVFQMEMRP